MNEQTWTIIDLRRSGQEVSKPYGNRTRARTRADKLNLQYGAHRYAVRNNVSGFTL